jgi:hypothetical protein
VDVNLEEEMKKDAIVIQYLGDIDIAKDFYRSLCNMRWRKIGILSSEDHVVSKLKGEDAPDIWSCTWRYAGGVIADIRNEHYNKMEDYMDFYCSGNEGTVSDLVEECFNRMGWDSHPYPNDESEQCLV